MTLPASGTISLSQIASEFGLAADAAFPSAFYGKGGAPTSGALSFSDFYGRSSAIVVTADPTAVAGYDSSTPVYGGPCNVSVSGGTAPYTYAWTRASGDAAIIAVTPSSSSTVFRAPMGPGVDTAAIFTCTVTDSTAGTPLVGTVDVDVSLSRA